MLKIVNVNGQIYLGNFEKKENGDIVITDALVISNGKVDENSINDYLIARETGKLVSPEFGGAGITHSCVDLDADLKIGFEIAEKQMSRAKDMAPKNLIASQFLELRGKA